jgi:hypothetical protein
MTRLTLIDGRSIDLWRPNPADVFLSDIANTLAVIPRWGGRAVLPNGEPWTVGQHSLLVHDTYKSLYPGEPGADWALLHDAHEAYTGDIPTPVKVVIGARQVVEVQRKLDDAIRTAFRIEVTSGMLGRVQYCDHAALKIERDALFMGRPSAYVCPAPRGTVVERFMALVQEYTRHAETV